MDWMMAAVSAAVPGIVCGVFLYCFQRRQNKKDKSDESRADARRRESLLLMELQMATAKLSYAVAMALKRGSPNGEVEDGVVAYEAARKKYLAFLNEQAAEHLTRA